ncbi:hypothetical protein [Limnoglobus roseus]|nr:hypothetical protein [Limnoglobus roseus]
MPLNAFGVGATHVGGNYSAEEVEFLKAMDAYQRTHRRPFPSWTEALKVLKSLGYRKVQPAVALPRPPHAPQPEGEPPCPSSAESPPS